jgi:hypothetical protein
MILFVDSLVVLLGWNKIRVLDGKVRSEARYRFFVPPTKLSILVIDREKLPLSV